jgi:hypothetical protein
VDIFAVEERVLGGVGDEYVWWDFGGRTLRRMFEMGLVGFLMKGKIIGEFIWKK